MSAKNIVTGATQAAAQERGVDSAAVKLKHAGEKASPLDEVGRTRRCGGSQIFVITLEASVFTRVISHQTYRRETHTAISVQE